MKATVYLTQCVESLMAQTYTNWEVLISAANDGTLDVARKLAARDPRVVAEEEVERGFANNVNACFEMAAGDIIARQQADDWSAPTRLEKQVAMLIDGQHDLCSCGMVRYMRDGSVRHMDVGGMKPREFVTLPSPHGPGSDSIAAWRRVYGTVGLYDATYDASADTDWTLRVLATMPEARWGHVDEDLYCYRDHPGQMTKRWRQEGLEIHWDRQAFYKERILAVFR